MYEDDLNKLTKIACLYGLCDYNEIPTFLIQF